MKKTIEFIGRLLIVAAVFIFLAWMQGTDPDCIYELDFFFQYRLCAPEYVGEPSKRIFLPLLVAIVVFVVGAVLTWLGTRKIKMK